MSVEPLCVKSELLSEHHVCQAPELKFEIETSLHAPDVAGQATDKLPVFHEVLHHHHVAASSGQVEGLAAIHAFAEL